MSTESPASPWLAATQRLVRPDVGRKYVLWIDLPPTYDPDGDESHPLYLCFDAMWTYGTVVDTVRLLAPTKELPKAIVVGVCLQRIGTQVLLLGIKQAVVIGIGIGV